MEFSAPSVDPLVRPWRNATLIASGIAAFELLLLLIIGITLLSKTVSAHAREAGLTDATGIAQVKPRHPEPKQTTLSRAQTTVLVLNGNGVTGAAASEASRVRAHGYPEPKTGNAATSYGRTVVMYRPGRRPEAQRLAADLGVGIVGPLDGMSVRQLHGAQTVVVLGAS